MSTRLDSPVVVGVDGSADAARAVRYAARRAAASGCGVLLVNAVHEVVPVDPLWPLLMDESFRDASREATADARRLVDHLVGPQVPVEVQIALGPVVPLLVDASDGARLVVLGHRAAGTLARFFTGATTLGVAARAGCPVVSVPRTWDEDQPHRTVVAAVDGSEISREVLAHAFGLASEIGARLDVVHCWQLEATYSALFVDASMAREWRARTTGVITGFVDEWAARWPDVTVSTTLEYADVAPSLVTRSSTADALVVGRHGTGGIGGRLAMSMPGSTARALVQHARCPVDLVPPAPRVPALAAPRAESTHRSTSEQSSRPTEPGARA